MRAGRPERTVTLTEEQCCEFPRAGHPVRGVRRVARPGEHKRFATQVVNDRNPRARWLAEVTKESE